LAAAFVILAGPTVILNGSVWGQTDIIFTFWLLLTVYCCCAGRGALASLAYGMAFAFKLQSVFLGPFYLAMLLRRRVPCWSMVWLPVGWLLALAPPVVMGGPVWPFLRLPFTQTNELNALAINFANPWEIANVLHVPPLAGVRIGMALTVVAGLAVAALGLRPEAMRPRAIAGVAALSLLAMPYVMPRMHDRYYFPAEILLSLLACVDLAYLVPAGLVVSASLLSYVGFFTSEKRHPAMALAVMGTSLALLMVSRGALALTARRPAAEAEPPDKSALEPMLAGEGHVG
jgi:Gpi18-like mannosyltransferase